MMLGKTYHRKTYRNILMNIFWKYGKQKYEVDIKSCCFEQFWTYMFQLFFLLLLDSKNKGRSKLADVKNALAVRFHLAPRCTPIPWILGLASPMPQIRLWKMWGICMWGQKMHQDFRPKPVWYICSIVVFCCGTHKFWGCGFGIFAVHNGHLLQVQTQQALNHQGVSRTAGVLLGWLKLPSSFRFNQIHGGSFNASIVVNLTSLGYEFGLTISHIVPGLVVSVFKFMDSMDAFGSHVFGHLMTSPFKQKSQNSRSRVA